MSLVQIFPALYLVLLLLDLLLVFLVLVLYPDEGRASFDVLRLHLMLKITVHIKS